jgi:hypothetical protein
MSPDYRSEPSESLEGRRIARRAWESYAKAVNKPVRPLFELAARRIAASQVCDLIGFWTVWHLHGGFEGLEELGMHRATIFRRVKRFRTVFGAHPDEFEMPGVEFDPAAYWKHAADKGRK